MSDKSGVERDSDAVRSAISRFPDAILAFDGESISALNTAGVALMTSEAIRPGFVRDFPAHPLSRLLVALAQEGVAADHAEAMTFQSGETFDVEISNRSAKSGKRLTMILLRRLARRQMGDQSAAVARWNFTGRERDVAKALMRGDSTEQISEALGISPNTIKTHVASLLAKTETRTRSELVAKLYSGS